MGSPRNEVGVPRLFWGCNNGLVMYDSLHNGYSSLGDFGQPPCDLYNISWKSILFCHRTCSGEPSSSWAPKANTSSELQVAM